MKLQIVVFQRILHTIILNVTRPKLRCFGKLCNQTLPVTSIKGLLESLSCVSYWVTEQHALSSAYITPACSRETQVPAGNHEEFNSIHPTEPYSHGLLWTRTTDYCARWTLCRGMYAWYVCMWTISCCMKSKFASLKHTQKHSVHINRADGHCGHLFIQLLFYFAELPQEILQPNRWERSNCQTWAQPPDQEVDWDAKILWSSDHWSAGC